MPIKSTKIFRIFTGVALLNAAFDLVTVYTVNNRDIVPDTLNLAAHIIYLMSILGFIYVLFLYMRSFLEGHLKFGRTVRVLHSLPFIASTVGNWRCPLHMSTAKRRITRWVPRLMPCM
ncbi:MAG: hypothetical protein NC223_02155 [Butyrivibrio sp.]|nr:hypothetical protein [Butyrivibrio sp.]